MIDAWSAIDATLGQKGFVAVTCPFTAESLPARFMIAPSNVWYFGTLKTKRGTVAVYLSVSDLEFTVPPCVWLDERPSWLTGWRPHLLSVGSTGKEWLCYSDHESFQLLSHAPGRALLRVLEDAVITIDRIADPISVIADSQREFGILWHSSNYLIFSDVEPARHDVICPLGEAENDNGGKVYLLSENPHELAKKVGIKGTVKAPHRAVIFPEATPPLFITSVGPPENLAEVNQWLLDTSPDMHKRWRSMMSSQKQYEHLIRFHFFRSSSDLIGFAMMPDRRLSEVRGARNIRKFLDRQIYKHPAPIDRLSVTRLDDTYLVRRNLPADMVDLRGRKVLLIGCGTVGGYLAIALSQIGAGANVDQKPGCLTLCDVQTFTPQNVGRHVLGLSAMGVNKALAMKREIALRHPGLNVESVDSNAFHVAERYSEFDLIINATGFEPVGRRLSKYIRKANWFDKKNAVLHVWVEGQGGVVRTLLEDDAKAACFDCMWAFSVNQEPKLRFPAYSENEWYDRSHDGYAAMTPFSVSASHAATALAVDATLGWLSKKAAPRFRSRSAEGEGIKSNSSCNLSRHSNCPTCSI